MRHGDDGRRLRGLAGILALVLGTWIVPGTARADIIGGLLGKDLNLRGFVRNETAMSVAGANIWQNDHGYSTDGKRFNMIAFRGELFADYRFSRNFNLYIHPRLWVEGVQDIDGALNPHIDSFGKNRASYSGDGMWLEVKGDEFIFDIPELYADYTVGRLWFRVGKQSIVWGKPVFFRVADTVNSLDTRRQHVFGPIFEEYADERLGMWTLRTTYDLIRWKGNITAFASPHFIPLIIPQSGTPYTTFPSQAAIKDKKEVGDLKDRWVWGAAINGNLGAISQALEGLELQANYVSRPQTLGVFRLKEGNFAVGGNAIEAALGLPLGSLGLPDLIPTPFQTDEFGGFRSGQETRLQLANARLPLDDVRRVLEDEWGIPQIATTDQSLDVIYGAVGPLSGVVTREFPRIHIVGGSFSYFVNPVHTGILGMLNGTIFRGEVMYEIDKDFTTPGLSRDFHESSELNTAFIVEKWVRFTPSLPATYLVAEYWFKSRSDFLERWQPGEGDSYFDVVGFAAQQQLMQNRLTGQATFAYDLAGGYWFQPGVLIRLRPDIQLDIFLNIFGGDVRGNDLFGTFKHFDELFVRTWYRF
jgi:hypothetical protein